MNKIIFKSQSKSRQRSWDLGSTIWYSRQRVRKQVKRTKDCIAASKDAAFEIESMSAVIRPDWKTQF